MNIYVGNLAHDVNEEDLQDTFKEFGQLTSATIIKDKFSGESRGFGFVEMPGKAEAQSAIDGLNGKELKGKRLNINEARPREEHRGGGGRFGGGGGKPSGGRRDNRGRSGGPGRGGGKRY